MVAPRVTGRHLIVENLTPMEEIPELWFEIIDYQPAPVLNPRHMVDDQGRAWVTGSKLVDPLTYHNVAWPSRVEMLAARIPVMDGTETSTRHAG
ncbi:hypothetical protein ACIGXM_14555 [Kitasatospora sp. NPDC052896]|uniref:hypothetical protein n=1 Tax=Kitasatospora sp. NPDC052896 TaxID=3364061 RepID=UPI0037C7C776